MAIAKQLKVLGLALVLCSLLFLAVTSYAQSEVLGEIELVGATKVEKTSGVWVDGQYLGYLKELKGSKKILLLPGQHEIVVRQDGYQDFTSKVTVRPGEKQTISVKMVRDPRFKMPSVFCEIKLSVTPDRAAVFVDEQFVGHAGEFGGVAKRLLIAPGHRKITISLPWISDLQHPMAGACTRGALTTSLIQERSVEIRSHSAGGFGELKEVHA